MPTVFPSSLDNFTNPTPADNLNTPAVLHSDEHANANDAIEAVEAWVGISGTVAQASHEYRIKQLENAPPGASAFGVAGQDEGVPLGTGSTLNVVGSNVVLSRSGTVLMLTHTNPPFPQEVIGVMGWNNGVPLGTGSVVDFGNNLTVTLSGTVLRVDATAGGGSFAGVDQIGIFGKDEGVSQGTGTILNVVGSDISLSLSGTTLTLLHTNPAIVFPQEIIGIFGQDEGINLGTGTILNAVGNNIALSLSGNVLQLLHTDTPVTFPQEVIGVMGQLKGVPLGTGSTFNVNGSRLTFTLSGTSLELSNSPEPQDNIGIFGSGLGTGTILSVAGTRLSMTLTGSSLNIISSPDPQDNIGVFAFDDASAVGTGTSISFGANLTVVRTGTVLFVDASAGGGGGGGQIGIMGWDEGIPVGTGSVLNATGGRATLTRSGTVLNFNISPDPFDNIGVMGVNQGTSLGTGTTLSVTGTRISMSLVNNVLNLNISPEPVDNIGIYALNNGVILGTGTWVDFGNNLSTSISGTTLRVNVNNTVFPQDNIGMMGQSKGINLGTGTTLNVNGTRLTLTQSGTVLELSNSPDPAELIGMMGSGLGTGTILSVSGGRLSMTLTGSSLNIISSPEPIDNIGIFALDDGAVVGTGTTVNFGNNLTVVRTGTTLFVDAVAGQGGGGSTNIVAWDDGVFKGTGSIIDFRNNLTVTFSGTVITVDGSAGGGAGVDQIGVFGINQGTNLGTGTKIDFGYGLNAAITGTTLFVHPFEGGANGKVWTYNTGVAQGISWQDNEYNIQFYLGNGVDIVLTGSMTAGYPFVDVPTNSIVDSWSIVADVTGSITANILKSTFAGFPPASPLAGLGQAKMTNLRTTNANASGTASILKTDQLLLSVDTVSTVKLVTVSLRCRKLP